MTVQESDSSTTMHQIKELQTVDLPSEFIFASNVGSSEKKISGLSKINLFIGPNNSGKSRCVRELAKIEKPVFVPTCDISQIQRIRNNFIAQIDQIVSAPVVDAGGFKSAAHQLPAYEYVTADFENFTVFYELAKKAAEVTEHGFNVEHRSYQSIDTRNLIRRIKAVGQEALAELQIHAKDLPLNWNFSRIYVPALRGLRMIADSDVYRERTINDYFTGVKNPPELFTGLEMYNRIRALLLGNLREREIVLKLQNFLSENFFDRKPLAIIPRINDVLHVKIGDEKEQPIHNFGDGIAMIIVMVFPLFLAGDRQILAFIEEPELFLHPGLQRTLVRTLASFDNAQFFIATHSNHLLDLTTDRNDISVYAVTKELSVEGGSEKTAKICIEIAQSGHSGLLNLLGVRNSSVFLSNCTIWVEGITDRRYLRRFLKIYALKILNLNPDQDHLIPYKEDLHYSFVEYGGSNITHWSFLDDTTDSIVVDRLCGRLLLIADKDESSAKNIRHEKLKAKLGDRFLRLERREIENILLPTTLTAVVSSYEKGTGGILPFEYADYADTSLGLFIENRVLKNRKRRGSYATESGTIADKLEFCDRALSKIGGYDALSVDAIVLCERMYSFIKEHNPS